MISTAQMDPEDLPILEEIQDRYKENVDLLAPIKKQGDIDMRFVDGDPWDPDERRIREAAMRPCLKMDEINQYENQVINDIRANKRAVKFSPVGDGANDATARFYGDLMREVEYRSNAQIAYTTALANAVWRSYGYVRLTTRFQHESVDTDAEPTPELLNQEVWIEEIADPVSIVPDMTFKRPDMSDIQFLFVLEERTHKEFSKQFPDAKIQSFTPEMMNKSQGMITAKSVILAEYWHLVDDAERSKTLALVRSPEGEETTVFLDSFTGGKPPAGFEVLRSRKIIGQAVKKILTNGVEVLERSDWAGKYIPFAGCFGKMLWRDKGSGSERIIHSMTRLARDPQMLYAYYETAIAESIRLSAKFPYFYRRGSLTPESLLQLQQSYDQPVVAIAVEGTYDGAPPGQEIPFPQRAPFEPPIMSLSAGAEGARRAIQAAMGQSFLPTQAQGRNEKSGIALKQIKDAGQQGSYHFIDSYNHMLRHVGVMCEDLFDQVYDTERTLSVIRPDGTSVLTRINAQPPAPGQAQPPETPEMETLLSIKGHHAVTISVGPSDDSEREAGTDYTSSIVSSPEILQMAGPQKAMKLLALVTKLRNLGPYGDAIAEIFDPSQAGTGMKDIPPQAQEMLQQAKQLMEALKQENDQLKQAMQTKQVEQQGKLEQIAAQGKVDSSLSAQSDLTKIQIEEMKAAQQSAEASHTQALDRVMAHLEMLKTSLEAQRLERDDHEAERQRVHEAEMAETDHQRALEGQETAHEQQLDMMQAQPPSEANE